MQFDRPILTATFFFIVLALSFFLVAPQYNNFQSLKMELGKKKAEFNAQYDYYNSVDNLERQLQTQKGNIAKIDSALPSEPDLGRLIYAVQRLASETGMLINSFSLNRASSSKDKTAALKVNDTTISLSLTGTYNDLGRFMKALEKSSKIFEISSISFGGSSSQSSQGGAQFQLASQQMYSFSMEVKTYSY